MIIIVNGGGKIIMWSENASPTPGAGQTLVALTDDQAVTLRHLEDTPNGGLQYDAVNGITALPFAAPVLPDLSNIDNLDRTFRALGLMISNFTGKTPAQVKQAFTTAYNSISS